MSLAATATSPATPLPLVAQGADSRATRPRHGDREPSDASTISSSSEAYTDAALGLPLSTSTSTLSSTDPSSQPLQHASYPEHLGIEDEDVTLTAGAQRPYGGYPAKEGSQQRRFSNSSSNGTVSPSATILPTNSNTRHTESGTEDDYPRSPTSPSMGSGSGQVARGGRMASYPPISEDDEEAREVEKNLERWAAEERQRRKALRASRSGSLLAPPAASALARRLSSIRRSPSSNAGSKGMGRQASGSSGMGLDGGSPTEQVPLEELLEEEGGSSSTHSGSFGRRAGQNAGRRSSGYGSNGLARKLNGNHGRESVSSVESYTSADALTRSGSLTHVSGLGSLPGATQGSSGAEAAPSPNTTPSIKQIGFFEINGTPDGLSAQAQGGLFNPEHVSGGDPASNNTPKPTAGQNTTGNKAKGKGRALDFAAGADAAGQHNPFEDENDAHLDEQGDVSGVPMSEEHDLQNNAAPTRRRTSANSNPPQLRIIPDDSSQHDHNQQHLSRSFSTSSSYASSTLPAYAKPKPSALRPIVTVGREAPATLERQRREAEEREASWDGEGYILSGDDGEPSRSTGAGRSSKRNSGSGSAYHMSAGGSSYGSRSGGGRGRGTLGKRRSHRTIVEGPEEPDEEEGDEEEDEDGGLEVGTPVSAPRRRSTHDSRFNEVGLDDEEEEAGREEDADAAAARATTARRRRAAAAAAAAQRQEEEEQMRAGRQPWWTEWLCGCGRHAADEDEQQYGKTNPMG
ncbi:hypothetical protein V8E36_003728 [Tilletia maclaganii]